MNRKVVIAKTVSILAGGVIAAYGITLALYAGFGRATLAVLWEGVALKLHITIGQASLLVAFAMLLFGVVYDRHQVGVGTVLYQLVYGYFIDVFANLHRYPESRVLCFLIMCAGIVILSIGVGIYSAADWGRGTYEMVSFGISEKMHWQIRYVRMAVDVAVTILGMLLGGKAGLCTIVTILLSGNVIQRTVKLTNRYLWKKE